MDGIEYHLASMPRLGLNIAAARRNVDAERTCSVYICMNIVLSVDLEC